MTFEEMQQTLEQMLSVQRELQNSQLRLLEAQQQLQESQQRQQGILDQLVGYSLTNESEHLDLQERLNALAQRIRRLEE
ncbi:MAG: hypothetical protein O3C67_05835 [Cyanobacteria bacterium]|nr:hypothetical protein [Cyanobacteriota bacterium]